MELIEEVDDGIDHGEPACGRSLLRKKGAVVKMRRTRVLIAVAILAAALPSVPRMAVAQQGIVGDPAKETVLVGQAELPDMRVKLELEPAVSLVAATLLFVQPGHGAAQERAALSLP